LRQTLRVTKVKEYAFDWLLIGLSSYGKSLDNALMLDQVGGGRTGYDPRVYEFLELRTLLPETEATLSNLRGDLWYYLSGAAELAMEAQFGYQQMVAVKELADWEAMGGNEETFQVRAHMPGSLVCTLVDTSRDVSCRRRWWPAET
jgi:hypothetical protein